MVSCVQTTQLDEIVTGLGAPHQSTIGRMLACTHTVSQLSSHLIHVVAHGSATAVHRQHTNMTEQGLPANATVWATSGTHACSTATLKACNDSLKAAASMQQLPEQQHA